MAAALNRSLSTSSALAFLFTFASAWSSASAQNSGDAANDTLAIAFQGTTQVLSALGTLTQSSLPADCFSLESRSNTGAVSWFQGCDAISRKSCCPGGYSTRGFYSATECPLGYTSRAPEGPTAQPDATYLSVDRTTDEVTFCCPTPNPMSGWEDFGVLVSSGLLCHWTSVDAQASTTRYQRAAASAIVIVSAAGASSRSTDGSPAETSTSTAAAASSGGMSNGAIIGISVGVGLPVLAILGFLIYKFGGGRKEKGSQDSGAEESGGVGGMMY